MYREKRGRGERGGVFVTGKEAAMGVGNRVGGPELGSGGEVYDLKW